MPDDGDAFEQDQTNFECFTRSTGSQCSNTGVICSDCLVWYMLQYVQPCFVVFEDDLVNVSVWGTLRLK